MVFEIGNVVESTTRTDPPASGVFGTLENANEYACEATPWGLTGRAALSDSGGAARSTVQLPGRHTKSRTALTCREDIQLLARDVRERGDIGLEVLSNDLHRNVSQPVSELHE